MVKNWSGEMNAPLSPYMAVKNAADAIDFYVKAFGAEEIMRMADPGSGLITHASLRFGGSELMLSDEFPDYDALGPESVGGSPVKLHLYVDDVDAVFARALDLGASEVRPLADQFYGDRSGMLKDPFGHVWSVATKKEEVSPEELQRRWAEMTSQ